MQGYWIINERLQLHSVLDCQAISGGYYPGYLLLFIVFVFIC